MGVGRRDAAAYRRHLYALLPSGAIWPPLDSLEGTTLGDLLEALAEELARADARACVLFDEADPSTASELFPEWEALAGLPDPCLEVEQTLAERRAALVAKLTGEGVLELDVDLEPIARNGQSPEALIAAALAAGFVITIDEFVGDTFRAGDGAGEELTGAGWRTHFTVNAPTTTIRTIFRAGSAAGEPLRTWGNEPLECLISRLKPAHTTVSYAYA